MKIELKRVGLFSAVKTLFILGGVTGFLAGILEWVLLAFLASVGESLPTGMSGVEQEILSEFLNAGVGVLAIFLPLFGGFAGAIGGVILGAILTGIYNVSARLWGGLEVECSEVAEPAAVQFSSTAVPSVANGVTPLPTVHNSSRESTPPSAPPEQESRPPSMYE